MVILQPEHAAPHHVVMVADPQLVDPHTYPGRPWPLSTLTVLYTDLYMRRTFGYLEKHLHPDTVFFLGDLFDGGREWSTPRSKSPETRYRKYGDSFWMREYKRFKKIFIDQFYQGLSAPDDVHVPTRRFIASLPGNHDLGFASGIQLPVKERFQAYFGDGNRIDIVGNHSFISVDSVSLSAMDQADPITGSSGSADGSASSPAMRAIWEPTQEFLNGVSSQKRRWITEEVLRMKGYPSLAYHQEWSHSKLSADVVSLANALDMVHNAPSIDIPSTTNFPNILLTHVPLYRPPESDCGPLREKGKGIPIHAGYQYQNVLTGAVSTDIMNKIGSSETAHVYSGDDHDYCDYTHTEYTTMVKETTVKSISWAMGVRKPGFLSVSLWNPVNLESTANEGKIPQNTIQEHLCLMPDQIGILFRYGQLLGLTLLVIATYCLHNGFRTARTTHPTPLLPSWRKRSEDGTAHVGSSSASSTSGNQEYLSSRNGNAPKGRSGSTFDSRPSTPPSKDVDLFGPRHKAFMSSLMSHMPASKDVDRYDDWGMPVRRRARGGLRGFLFEFRRTTWSVAWPVLLWYVWIIRHG